MSNIFISTLSFSLSHMNTLSLPLSHTHTFSQCHTLSLSLRHIYSCTHPSWLTTLAAPSFSGTRIPSRVTRSHNNSDDQVNFSAPHPKASIYDTSVLWASVITWRSSPQHCIQHVWPQCGPGLSSPVPEVHTATQPLAWQSGQVGHLYWHKHKCTHTHAHTHRCAQISNEALLSHGNNNLTFSSMNVNVYNIYYENNHGKTIQINYSYASKQQITYCVYFDMVYTYIRPRTLTGRYLTTPDPPFPGFVLINQSVHFFFFFF